MPDFRCECMATMTFSSAVMRPKSRMFWNVRAMPQPAILCGGIAGDVARRRSTTAPSVGCVEAGEHVEERRLAGAVGPDQADDRLARDREETSLTATRPPNWIGDAVGVRSATTVRRELRVAACSAAALSAGHPVQLALHVGAERLGLGPARARCSESACVLRLGISPSRRNSIISTRIAPKMQVVVATGSCQSVPNALVDRSMPICFRPVVLIQASTARRVTPQTLPMPPSTTIASSVIEMRS